MPSHPTNQPDSGPKERITNASTQAEASETTETNAQQLTRRRQRDALIGVLGFVLAIGALLAVRLAPSWANPVATGVSTAGVYAAVVVPYLLRRR
ncbi:hypothetical protein [Streptomyces sp. NBC_01296]|uniref:hypothetical protein n=1 Tax=Streptomyces sp. NBC_01296 TaxID=2903816 RepID=UPI002E0D91CC|nr:hypothetical protein OG299_00005 [Streptomyces sp. NBC_01296]WSN53474.1 hypothetical protein OG299_40510 [Streptomyces sp. NBC_01296]WSN54311.1 hypothetical protein OG299_42535 [Streptomyces sp. NBC_01296]